MNGLMLAAVFWSASFALRRSGTTRPRHDLVPGAPGARHVRWVRETRDLLTVRVTPQELVDEEFAAWHWSEAA
jgi:hypothetical protein